MDVNVCELPRNEASEGPFPVQDERTRTMEMSGTLIGLIPRRRWDISGSKQTFGATFGALPTLAQRIAAAELDVVAPQATATWDLTSDGGIVDEANMAGEPVVISRAGPSPLIQAR